MSALDYLPTTLSITDKHLERVPKKTVRCLVALGAIIYFQPRDLSYSVFLLADGGKRNEQQVDMLVAAYLKAKDVKFYRYFPEGS